MPKEVRGAGRGGRHREDARPLAARGNEAPSLRASRAKTDEGGEPGKRGEENEPAVGAHEQTGESFTRGERGWGIKNGVDQRKNWSAMWGHSLWEGLA